MYIAKGKQLGTCETRKSMVRDWKQNPANFDKAVHAAWYYAKKEKTAMIVIVGNSYTHKVHNITHLNGSVKYFTGPDGRAYVQAGLVYPNGEVFQIYVSDKANVETPNGATI